MLRREVRYLIPRFTVCGKEYVTVCGRELVATQKNDVRLPISPRPPEYPPCPDCGGKIIRSKEVCYTLAGDERYYGSRECEACGSRFTDPRYSANPAG